MVTIQRAQQGIARFIDAEVVPRLSIAEKLIVGGGAGLATAKLPSLLEKLSENQMVAALGIYDREHGEIDVEALYSAIQPYIGADPIPVKLPMVGLTLKFTKREFDALYKSIMEA